jgi:hypothetical protein
VPHAPKPRTGWSPNKPCLPEMSDDVLVKVDNASKRFCRSLKRSLWYGLQYLGGADVQLRPDKL